MEQSAGQEGPNAQSPQTGAEGMEEGEPMWHDWEDWHHPHWPAPSERQDAHESRVEHSTGHEL